MANQWENSFIRFDPDVKAIIAALDDKQMKTAIQWTLKNVKTRAVMVGRQQITKRFNITQKRAQQGGALKKPRYELSHLGGGKFLALIKLRSYAVNLYWFRPSAVKESWFKTPVGKSGKLRRRRRVRIKLLKPNVGGKLKMAPRRDNEKKRWAHPRPEFMGFRIHKFDDNLVFFRKNYPVGGKGARDKDRYPTADTMVNIDTGHMMFNPNTIGRVYDAIYKRTLEVFPRHLKRQFDIAHRRAHR